VGTLLKRSCVFDLEGNGLFQEITKLWCGVFKDIKTGEVFKFKPNEHKQMFEFMDTCDKLIGHNVIGYDFPVLKKLFGYEYKGKVVDTLLISRLMFPSLANPKGMKGKARPHSIEAWGYRFGRWKPDHEDWSQFSEAMLHRCSEDVEIQYLLFCHLAKEAKNLGWPSRAFDLTFKLFQILTEQEHYGWLIDRPRLERYVRTLTRSIQRIDAVVLPMMPNIVEQPYKTPVSNPFKKDGCLASIALKWYPDDQGEIGGAFSRVIFRKVNIASDKEVKEYLLSEGWKPKEWNYKKENKRVVKDDQGNPVRTSPKLSADDDFIGVNGRIGRIIAKRVKCRHGLSTLEGWRDNIREDGRIGQFISGIAATGRLTHQGIVNVPGADKFFGKQMRSVFTSKPGYKIVGTDSASCQDRMLAGRANDEGFTEMLLNGDKSKGTDGHTLNMKAVNAVLERHGKPLINRGSAKNFGYGWKFGASDKKLGSMALGSKELGAEIRDALSSVSQAQAKLIERLTEEWKKTATRYMNDWGKADYRNGYIMGLDGRPVYIQSEHQILVYVLQSDEAIMMQYALCFLKSWLDKLGWVHGREYGFVANVHDEYQCEVREDLVEQYTVLADKSIVKAAEFLGIQCPHVGESDVGNNWSETH
jgi:DNA polymerase I-like protein with 3'-5' exonuclease and polymerase domains